MNTGLLRNSGTDSINKAPDHRLTSKERPAIFTLYVAKLEIGPGQEIRLSLGTFTSAHQLLGFSIEFSPELESADSVATKIISVGSAKRYELLLSVTNHTEEIISAEVRRMRLR